MQATEVEEAPVQRRFLAIALPSAAGFLAIGSLGVVGVALFAENPGSDLSTTIIAALVALLAGMSALQSVVHTRRDRKRQQRLADISHRTDRLAQEVSVARSGLMEIHSAIKENGGDKQRVSEMLAEVEVLQKLVSQLWASHAGPGSAEEESDDGGPRPASALADHEILDVARDALAMGRVDLYLQPIVRLPQRKHQFYECFSRLRDETGAVVEPDRYIALAEKAGLVATIDNMLLFRCIQLIRVARQRNPSVGFFCNISRHSLRDRTFLRDFADFIDMNADLAPSLVFEFGQSDLDLNDPVLMQALADLASTGLRFSVDKVTDLNFDAPALARANVRFVKLDAARFGSGSTAGIPSDLPVMRLRRELSRNGIDLIIEKVESEGELVELLDYEVSYGQGYLFGAPKLGPQKVAS